MNISQIKFRANEYFKKNKPTPQRVTLAGLTRKLDFGEGDIELFMDDSNGRKVLMDIYMKLAEILEIQANLKPSPHRTEMIKALNKFTGGLYTYEKASKEQYLDAKTTFAEIDQRSQKRLMKAIAQRNNK